MLSSSGSMCPPSVVRKTPPPLLKLIRVLCFLPLLLAFTPNSQAITGEDGLLEHFYGSILDRAADSGGKDFWLGEGTRMNANGVDAVEAYLATARYFYSSDEFTARGFTPEQFVISLYRTFLNRDPDQGELGYWVGVLASGLPRDMVMYAFMFSSEFNTLATQILGAGNMRPEVGAVIDFYRGSLGRLPDTPGLGYWAEQFRTAQCLPEAERTGGIYQTAIEIAEGFFTSGEYWANGVTPRQYISDLYNAFMRRSADLEGFLYWVQQLESATQDHAQIRKAFIDSSEFAARVAAMVDAGCPALLNQAVLGPLSGTEIRAYRLTELNTPVEGPIIAGNHLTDLKMAGAFKLALAGVPDDEWILVTASGGMDIDADDDGVVDDTPTTNAGTLYAVAPASDWRAGGVRISALSDMAWRFTKALLDHVSPEEIGIRLDDLARLLLLVDLNGDGRISGRDLAYFEPADTDYRAALNFNYADLFTLNDQGQSIVKALHGGEPALVGQLLESYLGTTLSLVPARDSRYTDIKIQVQLFGHGSVSSADGRIDVDSRKDAAANQPSAWYTQDTGAQITLTAAPTADTEVIGWNGCDSLSKDLIQCTVALDRSRDVVAKFGYIEASTTAPLHLLTGATVVLGVDSVTATIAQINTALKDELKQLQIGDFITGPTEGGFLRKVTDFTRHDDFHYDIITVEASLEDVLAQGSGSLRKKLTNGDLVGYVPAASGSSVSASSAIGAQVAATAFSGPEGVRFIPSGDASDTVFRFQIGAPSPKEGALQPMLGTSQTLTLWEDKQTGGKITASGSLDIEIDIDFSASVGLFSGLEDFTWVTEIQATEGLELQYEGEIASFKEKKKLKELHFTAIKFFVGPVPVWISPQVDIFIGVEGKLSLTLTTGIEFQQTLRGGVVYNKNVGWNTIQDFSHSVTPQWPELNLEAELKGYVEASPVLKIYSLTGPSLPLAGYLKLFAVYPVLNEDLVTGEGCHDGLEAGFKAGVESKFSWIFEGSETKLGKLLHLDELEFEFSLFKQEWLLKHWYITGSCAEDPPYLRVDGPIVTETITYQQGGLLERTFTLTNEGSGQLPWDTRYIEDAAINIAPRSGALGPGESTMVTLSLDTDRLNIGTYRNPVSFENSFRVGELLTYAPLGSTERNIRVEVVPELTQAPRLTLAEGRGPGWAYLEWSFDPSGAPMPLHGYQIYMSQNPGDETSWRLLATVTDINASGSTVYGLPGGMTYFLMDAYAGSARTPVSNSLSADIEASAVENGLIAYYPFDSSASDASGNGHDGTESGGVTYESGVIGQSANFDGVDDYVVSGYTPIIEPSDSFSVSVWFKSTTPTSRNANILGLEKRGAQEFTLLVRRTTGEPDYDGRLYFAFRDDSYKHSAHFSQNRFDDGLWHHVVAMRDVENDRLRVYVDGNLEIDDADDTVSALNKTATRQLHIGTNNHSHYASNLFPLKGGVDDFRWYNRVLTPTEVNQLYMQ